MSTHYFELFSIETQFTHIRRTRASAFPSVSFDTKGNFVHRIVESHAQFFPGIEMGGDIDGSAQTLAAAAPDAPILSKGSRTLDGRLVFPDAGVNVVSITVNGNRPLERTVISRRPVVFPVIDNVKLDEIFIRTRIKSSAVYAEIGNSFCNGIPVYLISDGLNSLSRTHAVSSQHIVNAAPGNIEGTVLF